MHYFGLMHYPKEMQFMDAPRNQPLRRSSAPHCPTPAAVAYYTCGEGFAAAGRSVCMQLLPATYIQLCLCTFFQVLKSHRNACFCPGRRTNGPAFPWTQFMYDFFSIQILFPSIPMNRNILQVYNETPGHTPNPASICFP